MAAPHIKPIRSTQAAPAIGPYEQAVRWGSFVFVSGQIPLDGKGNMIAGDMTAQTEQALRNMTAVLESAGSDLTRVLKTTVYLQDLQDFPVVNRVYEAWFKSHKPARATVGVASLPKNARIEIDCIAIV